MLGTVCALHNQSEVWRHSPHLLWIHPTRTNRAHSSTDAHTGGFFTSTQDKSSQSPTFASTAGMHYRTWST